MARRNRKDNGLHSFRYEGKYAGISKGQVIQLEKAGTKALEGCESVEIIRNDMNEMRM
jgi:hypothetical protein